jgi:hypothetical protein
MHFMKTAASTAKQAGTAGMGYKLMGAFKFASSV